MINAMIWMAVGFALAAGLVAAVAGPAVWRLMRAARRLAQGDVSHRIGIEGPRPLASLAGSLNQMGAQLEDRFETVMRQRNELGAVLSSMIEGVIAIDLEERIISLNEAAGELLGIDVPAAVGRPIQVAVRNVALQRFVDRTIQKGVALQEEITMRRDGEGASDQRILEAQSALLRDGDGREIGALLVLHDVTRLRRLEAVRRDFVANVSHEIKTPVSTIKAAVETMVDDPRHDTDTRQFLEMVARQSDRLAAIVDDLLSLARLEQEGGRIRAELAPAPVSEVLQSVLEVCQPMAQQKRITIALACEPALAAAMNGPLLEQAVMNLVDNAIKYSGEGTRVDVQAREQDGELVISVRDEGRGIEPEHLPRIFERFYRTDRARSRALGGTGLGLSIVKHVAQAHGGWVAVESEPGQGSTFRMHLPMRVAPGPEGAG
ncbi:MAG: ATP-binding protein [Phycisphaeraceae bacterium]